MSERPIRVLIVEDHYLARLAAVTFVKQAGMEVVGEAETGWQALALHARLAPDVVLMDLHLPQMDGAEAIARLRQENPGVRVLVLSHYEGEEELKRALAAGALGYVTKDAAAEVLIDALRRVARGEPYLPAPLAERLESAAAREPLTRRELDVLELMCQGRTNGEIAAALSLTEGTVRIYVTGIFFKLEVKRRTEAVAVALERGLVRPGP